MIVLSGYLVARAGEVKKNWGLVIEDGTIVSLGENQELARKYKGRNVLDASDKIVIPGFVNSHMHMYGLLSHGIDLAQAPAGFYEFLREFWWPRVEDKITHPLLEISTRLACLEMLRSGVTSFYDVLEAPHAIPGALEVEKEIVRRAGLRGVLSFEATERIDAENGLKGVEENVSFIKACREEGGLVGGMMCIHTTFTCSREFIQLARRETDKLDTLLHFHLEEGEYETKFCQENFGLTPTQYYDSLEVLGDKTLVSQVVNTDVGGLDLIKKRGVKVSHMPLSNCEVGGGIAPVPEMIEREITVGIGTDGYINNFFEVLRAALLIHKGFKRSPTVMPASLVFKMGTEYGAKAIGLDNVGVLEEGKAADITILRNNFATPINERNIFDQIILYANPQYVDSVLVNGRLLVEGGRVLTLEEEQIVQESRRAAERLWGGSLRIL